MGSKLFVKDLSERRNIILNGNPMKVLIMLSFPTVLMAFVQSMIPLTDGLFLNNSTNYVIAAAVGYSQPAINMLVSLSQGISVATMAIIGQVYGKNDLKAVKNIATQVIVFGILMGICMIPIEIIAGRIIANGLKDPTLATEVFKYLSYYSIVLPFLFMAAIFNAIKNATGQPEATLYRMIMLLVCKLFFNFIYLKVMHLQILGAALASLSSYVIISIWMYYDVFIKDSDLKLSLAGFKFDWQIITSLLKIAIPSSLTAIMVNLGFFLINNEIAAFGNTVLSAQTISTNINSLAFTLPSSISTTITTMISINIGVGREKQAKKVFHMGCILSLIISGIMILFFLLFTPELVDLFLKNPSLTAEVKAEIRSIAIYSLHIYTFSIVGFGIFMVAQGACIGLGKTNYPLFLGILRIWFFRYLFILFFKNTMGYSSIFWGNFVSNMVSAVIFYIVVHFISWKPCIDLSKMSLDTE